MHGFGQIAVRSDAGLRHSAPEQAAVAGLHGWVGLGPDELALPVQRLAEPFSLGIQMIWFHAAPPAFRMARLTATRASWIFCVL